MNEQILTLLEEIRSQQKHDHQFLVQLSTQQSEMLRIMANYNANSIERDNRLERKMDEKFEQFDQQFKMVHHEIAELKEDVKQVKHAVTVTNGDINYLVRKTAEHELYIQRINNHLAL